MWLLVIGAQGEVRRASPACLCNVRQVLVCPGHILAPLSLSLLSVKEKEVTPYPEGCATEQVSKYLSCTSHLINMWSTLGPAGLYQEQLCAASRGDFGVSKVIQFKNNASATEGECLQQSSKHTAQCCWLWYGRFLELIHLA